MSKKYISKINKDGQDLYIKDAEAQERLDQLSEWESDGAIDTLFATAYVSSTEEIDFGGTPQNPTTCAHFDTEDDTILVIEGAVVDDTIIIS